MQKDTKPVTSYWSWY